MFRFKREKITTVGGKECIQTTSISFTLHKILLGSSHWRGSKSGGAQKTHWRDEKHIHNFR